MPASPKSLRYRRFHEAGTSLKRVRMLSRAFLRASASRLRRSSSSTRSRVRVRDANGDVRLARGIRSLKYFYSLSEQKEDDGVEKEEPWLWEKAKKMACSQAKMCKHSARKMQWASKYYRSHGGKYDGPLRSDNSLKKWTRQKWRTSDGKPSRG